MTECPRLNLGAADEVRGAALGGVRAGLRVVVADAVGVKVLAVVPRVRDAGVRRGVDAARRREDAVRGVHRTAPRAVADLVVRARVVVLLGVRRVVDVKRRSLSAHFVASAACAGRHERPGKLVHGRVAPPAA